MVFPKDKQYKLQCEWGSCSENFELMNTFYSHLEDHFWNDVATFPMQPGITIVCRWQECNFVTTDGHELIRHIYFHGFHTKLKWLGLQKHQAAKIEECRIQENRNIIPELPDGFRCCWDDCSVVVDIPDKFYDHVREHALISELETLPNGEKGFKCHWEDCAYMYPSKNKSLSLGRYKLNGHMSTHTQERLIACPWCGNLYVNNTKYIDHFTRQINVENHSFQCTHCSRTFASERILKNHMRHHVNHYQCPKCEMTCPNPSALKHHIRYKHSSERPYACEFCDYRSKEPHDLQTHVQFHQSDLAYHCQVADCDYVVRSLQNLRYHYRSKHGSGDGKYYACHKCNKTYGTGSQLTLHLRTAHNFKWPPGHCRFRYKECEDGKFRLQTFRYESIELTKQMTLVDPSDQPATTSVTMTTITSTQGKSNSKPKIKRIGTVRRKKGVRIRRGGTVENISPTRSVVTSSGISKLRARKKVSKTNPVKQKNSGAQQKKKTTPKRQHLLNRLDESLPDLFIDEEYVKAASTLCELKTNSAKKKSQNPNRPKQKTLCDSSPTNTSERPLAEVTMEVGSAAGASISEESLGVSTRSSSTKKRKSKTMKFSRAKKRLTSEFGESTTAHTTCQGEPLQSTINLKLPVNSYSNLLRDCSVDLIQIDEPVFPNHHRIYCSSTPKGHVTTDPATGNLPSIESFTLPMPKSNHPHTAELMDSRDGEEDAASETSSSKLKATSLLGCDLHCRVIDVSESPQCHPDVLDSPAAPSPGTSSPGITCTIISAEENSSGKLQGHSSSSADNNRLSTPNEDYISDSTTSGYEDESGMQLPDTESDLTPDGKATSSSMNNRDVVRVMEVSKEEIVTDENGIRTVVNVGGDDFFLVSGNDSNTGSIVYCLVKTSEYSDDNSAENY